VNRRERIVALLEHLPDYYALGQPGNDRGTGSDSNIGRFRLAEHPSVRELYRCLMPLRGEQPLAYKHLKSFYLAETKVARVGKRREVPVALRVSARFTYEPRSRSYAYRAQLVPSWVKPELVDAGVDLSMSISAASPACRASSWARWRLCGWALACAPGST
jgi:hypothetical protein